MDSGIYKIVGTTGHFFTKHVRQSDCATSWWRIPWKGDLISYSYRIQYKCIPVTFSRTVLSVVVYSSICGAFGISPMAEVRAL